MNYQIIDIAEAEHPLLVPVWESSVKATHHFLKDGDFQIFKIIVGSGIFKQVPFLKGVKNPEGDILGFMGISGDSLEMLFIHSDYRGKGIGGALLRFAIENIGVKRVGVNQQNTDALGFYEHFGFRTVSISETDGMGKPYPIANMELEVYAG